MSWPVVKLGDVVKFIGGSQPPKSTFKYEPMEGYIRLLQIRDYKSNNNLTFIPESSTKKFCSKKDIMIGRYGPPVFQILRGLEGAYNVALMKAEPSKSVDRDYLFYFLRQDTLFRLIDGLSQRTAGQSGIDMDALKSYPMLLPPLDEQKRIAAILDKADAIRRKRQQAIRLVDDFLRSVFLDMFGDPVTNPKGWQVELLGEHIRHANNGLSRRRKVEENIGDIVLRLQDVHYEGIRFGKELNRVDLEDKEKSRYRLDIGDLLFIRVNGNPEYVGRSAVFEGFNEAVFHNDHLIRIKVKDSFNSRFLSYMLNLRVVRK
ncbi:restriction endonuclease subunit S [Pseudoalteromonas sp. B160]|uniref:restriction endonuclease subunit S n=1 Tax=Pseudoalteromonas sp. B160 TaxID=630414 RepID=UPI00301E5831